MRQSNIQFSMKTFSSRDPCSGRKMPKITALVEWSVRAEREGVVVAGCILEVLEKGGEFFHLDVNDRKRVPLSSSLQRAIQVRRDSSSSSALRGNGREEDNRQRLFQHVRLDHHRMMRVCFSSQCIQLDRATGWSEAESNLQRSTPTCLFGRITK